MKLAIALSFALTTTVAQAQDFSKVRNLATLGGDGNAIKSWAYNPLDNRVFVADDKGFSLWSLDGMQKMSDTRVGNGSGQGIFDFATNTAYLTSEYSGDPGKMIDSTGKAADFTGYPVSLFNKRIYTARDNMLVLDSFTDSGRVVGPKPDGLRKIIPFSDGLQLFAVTTDRALLYQVSPGKLLKTFGPLDQGVQGVQLSPDGSQILLVNSSGIAATFELATGMKLMDFKLGARVEDASFSPDGKLIAFGFENDQIQVWDAEVGVQRAKMESDQGNVLSVAFSPDGKVISSGGYDGTIGLWNASTGQRLATLEGHTRGVEGLKFTWDGKYLLSVSSDNTIRVWGVPKLAVFASPAQLTVSSGTQGATALLDGTPLGNLDAAGRSLALAGEVPHRLIVTAPGHLPYTTSITLKAGEERTLVANPLPQTGKLTISSTPSSANVIVNGKVIGKTPVTLDNLPAGPLDYLIKFAGYVDFAGTAEVSASSPATTNAVLKEQPGLSVKSSPVGASVFLDGQPLGVTPLVTSGLKPGKYNLTLKMKGYKDQTVSVTIPATGKATVDVTLKK
ncbi:hypothetical protein Dxin01_03635 [Deinococcus xinjiangensis]|uniref:PEGA domain-containing protein n=1 Tax=Deinococcus xinjiangensis TaxID=457454 RepID=A0ABP9VIF7_9DEIO